MIVSNYHGRYCKLSGLKLKCLISFLQVPTVSQLISLNNFSVVLDIGYFISIDWLIDTVQYSTNLAVFQLYRGMSVYRLTRRLTNESRTQYADEKYEDTKGVTRSRNSKIPKG